MSAASTATVPGRVVLLGARGFVARTLLRGLAASDQPHLGLASKDIDLTGPQAADRLKQTLQPGDSVVMLSALTPDKGRGIAPFQANIQMMAAVVAACEAVPPAHFVYISSDAVYPMDGGLVSEASPAEPTDLYGAMHLARELMARGIKAPVAILRPTMVYGAEDTHNSYGPNRLRRMAQTDGRITLFGGGEEMRDHISVDDVCTIIRLVLERKFTGTLNLATGQSISYLALAQKVAALFGKAVEIQTTPRQNPITHRHFNTTVLKKAFPQFTFQSLDEGLAKAHRDMLASGS